MPMSNAEKQRQFKHRLYAAGYRQSIIWVPAAESVKIKPERKAFISALDAATIGLNPKNTEELYAKLNRTLKTAAQKYPRNWLTGPEARRSSQKLQTPKKSPANQVTKVRSKKVKKM